jgi:hypothetical protein
VPAATRSNASWAAAAWASFTSRETWRSIGSWRSRCFRRGLRHRAICACGSCARHVRPAQLSHPHIVPIHAVEEHASLVFFVMAYIDSETLGERVRRAGPLSSGDAMRIMQEVAWALAHGDLDQAARISETIDSRLAHSDGSTPLPNT